MTTDRLRTIHPDDLNIVLREHGDGGSSQIHRFTLTDLATTIAGMLGFDLDPTDPEVRYSVNTLLQDRILRFEGDPPIELVSIEWVSKGDEP